MIVMPWTHKAVLSLTLCFPLCFGHPGRTTPSHLPPPAFHGKRWSADEALDRLVRQPWRSRTVIHIPATSSNYSDRAFIRRAGRFADFSNEKWMQVDESSPPFLPSLGGLSFPLFAPSMAGGMDGGMGRGRQGMRGPQYPSSLDYDRSTGPAPPSEGLSRMPTNSYYDAPKNPSSPPGNPPPRGYGPNSASPPDRQRYSRPEKNKYGPYGQPGPISPSKGRPKGSSSNNNYGPPPEPFYPDYEDGVPRYSYNPSEIPKCAKESNVSYCIEDQEYPIETMQYEIDRDSSILEQILPDSEEKLELVEGIPKKDDEKYNFRHYFTYRVDELDNASKSQREQASFALKPDYYKDGGYICPSIVSYVQPRRARNTEGLWKVILNLRERYKGIDYKQNVRLEQCMHSGRECSFTSGFYNSQCIQKFNNVRLLAWTEERGIHLDIFRLPIACSCHFRGKMTDMKLK